MVVKFGERTVLHFCSLPLCMIQKKSNKIWMSHRSSLEIKLTTLIIWILRHSNNNKPGCSQSVCFRNLFFPTWKFCILVLFVMLIAYAAVRKFVCKTHNIVKMLEETSDSKDESRRNQSEDVEKVFKNLFFWATLMPGRTMKSATANTFYNFIFRKSVARVR